MSQEIEAPGLCTFRIPEDWVQIPKGLLDEYSDTVKRIAPKAPVQKYDYGFQKKRKGVGGLLDYPYILIHVNKDGRVPQSELSNMSEVTREMEKGVESVDKGLGPIATNATINEPYYDSSSHIIWTTISKKDVFVGDVKGLMGCILTEQGGIAVIGYSRAADFEKYSPLFEAVVRNIKVSPELRYIYHLSDFEMFYPILQFIGVVIIGLIVSNIMRKKKKKPAENGDNSVPVLARNELKENQCD